jgi:negative regulator of flagellin synthesis FlgM
LAEDTVELTSTATRLTQLKADVASAEGIDQARVAALREQIANGSYEINPERIADALIKLEQELV